MSASRGAGVLYADRRRGSSIGAGFTTRPPTSASCTCSGAIGGAELAASAKSVVGVEREAWAGAAGRPPRVAAGAFLARFAGFGTCEARSRHASERTQAWRRRRGRAAARTGVVKRAKMAVSRVVHRFLRDSRRRIASTTTYIIHIPQTFTSHTTPSSYHT